MYTSKNFSILLCTFLIFVACSIAHVVVRNEQQAVYTLCCDVFVRSLYVWMARPREGHFVDDHSTDVSSNCVWSDLESFWICWIPITLAFCEMMWTVAWWVELCGIDVLLQINNVSFISFGRQIFNTLVLVHKCVLTMQLCTTNWLQLDLACIYRVLLYALLQFLYCCSTLPWRQEP